MLTKSLQHKITRPTLEAQKESPHSLRSEGSLAKTLITGAAPAANIMDNATFSHSLRVSPCQCTQLVVIGVAPEIHVTG